MFATVSSVKVLDGGFKQNTNDGVLQVVVDGVNAKIEDLLDRKLIVADYTDTFNIYPTATYVYELAGFPVASVSEVRVDGSVLDSTYYSVNLTTGQIQLKIDQPRGIAFLEVDYNGGMAVDETALRATYPAIVYAANMQALFEFKRRDKIANGSMSIQGGGSETWLENKIQPEVMRVIRKYRRRRLVS